MSIESVMPSNHLILCRLLHLFPSIFPSIRVFSNESALFFFLFLKFYFIFKLYITVLVLPNIKMNPPQVYMCASGGQSIGVSASASVLPMNTQDSSPLGWTGWISLQSKGLSRVFSNTTVQKHQFFSTQLSL